MKNTILALLVSILLVGIVNLLFNLGVIGGGTTYQYQVLDPQTMDSKGFVSVAEEEGIEIKEDGTINFPKEMANKIMKSNLLPRTIIEVEAEGNWEFVAVTADNHYIFRKPK